ncbi:MAG: hypothetical protein ACOYOK_08660 [Pseudobdellovibrionaceae bacterium]
MRTSTISYYLKSCVSLAIFASTLWLVGCLEKTEAPTTSSSADSSSSSGTTLPINHPPTTDTASKTALTPQLDILGSRTYIRSFLNEIFTSANNTELNKILDKYLGADTEDGVSTLANFENMIFFGGACHIYSEAGYTKACANNLSNLYLNTNTAATASREAVRMKICAEITDFDIHVSAGLAKVSLTTASDVTPSGIASLFDLFYPGVTLDSATQTALVNLNNAQKSASETKTNQWRTLLFTLCRTPEWQAL